MIPVIVESPFAPSDLDIAELRASMSGYAWTTRQARQAVLQRNIRYVRAAMRDCMINHDEAPFASHALYTLDGVLDDEIRDERELGIVSGFVWREFAARTVVYKDLGISPGMKRGIFDSLQRGGEVVYRSMKGTLWHG